MKWYTSEETTDQKARFHSSCSTVGVALYSFFRCAPMSCAIRMPKLRIGNVPCGEFVALMYAAISYARKHPVSCRPAHTVGARDRKEQNTHRARLDVVQPRPRDDREVRRADSVEPLPPGGLVRLRVQRAVRPRAARRAHEQHDGAEAPVAQMQPVLDVALERRAVEQAEVRVEVGEVAVHEFGHDVWRREVPLPERRRGVGNPGLELEEVLNDETKVMTVSVHSRKMAQWGGGAGERMRTGLKRFSSSMMDLLDMASTGSPRLCLLFRPMTVRTRSRLLDLPV